MVLWPRPSVKTPSLRHEGQDKHNNNNNNYYYDTNYYNYNSYYHHHNHDGMMLHLLMLLLLLRLLLLLLLLLIQAGLLGSKPKDAHIHCCPFTRKCSTDFLCMHCSSQQKEGFFFCQFTHSLGNHGECFTHLLLPANAFNQSLPRWQLRTRLYIAQHHRQVWRTKGHARDGCRAFRRVRQPPRRGQKRLPSFGTQLLTTT